MDKDISKYLVERLATREGRLFITKFIDVTHEFDQMYHEMRQEEGRAYSDSELEILPHYNSSNKKLVKDWKYRKSISAEVINDIKATFKGQKINILDLGCGNGWFSNQLSEIPNSSVYALDIVMRELRQATKVFNKPNLQFIYGNLYRDILPDNSFHVITMSDTLQYFPTFNTLFKNLYRILKKNGEIHVFNTPFYKTQGDASAAEERSNVYFNELGYPQMKRHYFHHTVEDLAPFKPKVMYNPDQFKLKFSRLFLGGTDSPYPWYKFVKPESES